jgi:DnaJ-class molecular chaperone
MNINYYNILEISEQAEVEQIRKAYKRLAINWHPDKHQGCDKKKAENKFKEISEAYSVLSDCDKRLEYDNSRNGGSRIVFNEYNPFDVFNNVFGRRDPFFDVGFNRQHNPFEFYNKFKNPNKPIKTSIKKTTQTM